MSKYGGSNNTYDHKETEADRMEAAHHRRLREIHGEDEMNIAEWHDHHKTYDRDSHDPMYPSSQKNKGGKK